MASASSLLNFFALLIAVFGGSWELLVKPRLQTFGYGREVLSVNNQKCTKVPQLPACEKIVLHQPSGLLYLACSTPSSRTHWTPAVSRLNETGASFNDYVATYDPKTGAVTRLTLKGFESTRGLSLHGMDVVPSSSNPSDLFVYLVNHRAPLGNLLAKDVGADSVIEVFKTTVAGETLTHIATVQDPIIITPNDIVGSADGKSFYFTNDHGEKVGLIREADLLGRASTSVGHCHIDKGCKYAITNMHGNNGIARSSDGTFYVANCIRGGLNVLEEKENNKLEVVDFVPADRGMDNLSVDSEGSVWAAAFPNIMTLLFKHFNDPSVPSPSTALRFSANANYNKTSKEGKLKVETLFEDDGSVASGITSVVYDAPRNLLFLSGLASPNLAICKL